jgi:hypothetical protein
MGLPTPIVESPFSALTDGFSTSASARYGASASSPAGDTESEREDYFVSARGEETEVEDARRRARARLKAGVAGFDGVGESGAALGLATAMGLRAAGVGGSAVASASGEDVDDFTGPGVLARSGSDETRVGGDRR